MIRRLLLAITGFLPATAEARVFPDSGRYAVSISYGVFDYDLSGLGQSRMVAVRVERPFSKYVVAEGGILYTRPLLDSGDRTKYFIPELQVHVQLPWKMVAPYLGVGGGMAWDTRDRQQSFQDTRPTWDPTFSIAAGMRAWFTETFGGRAELRVRGIGGHFQGSSAEWTIGAALKL